MEVSLQELLESRDNRQAKQRALIKKYHQPLISLTVVMPGTVKRNAHTLFLSRQAVDAIRQKLEAGIVTFDEYDLKTGYEALFVVRTDALETKRMTCRIEDEHPLGRLFDIDVITEDGLPLSREDAGYNPRKCLLCNQDARVCMRNRTHTSADIQNKVKEMIEKMYDYQCLKMLK
ncbi:MAG: citrate lyase holo-[acyl-carrier protein] synthase [Prevotellaceae bacterium]|jgi:holo-ACP synthase CitX|nr:citrate lyase holo-[acyl-carrier protein] synthase [Prevotellaceae bacterium]